MKKISATAIIIFTTTISELYWAMGKLSGEMSSGCTDCSFFKEAFYMSLMTAVALTLLFGLLSLLKNFYLLLILELILLLSIWLFWNDAIFSDRKSSWSTYLLNEEMSEVISLSFLPILFLSILCLFALHFSKIKNAMQRS